MATAFLLMTVLLAVTVVEPAAPPPWRGGCTDELVWFSTCLAYVSCPPNNLTENATTNCCDAFSSGVNSICWCYLLRDPDIFGFPLNTTRLLSLSSLCPSPSPTSSSDFLCAESPALPPLGGAGIISPHVSAIGSRGVGGSSRGARGSSRGGMIPRSTGIFNDSTLTAHKSLLLSQLLVIILITLALLNTSLY